MRVGNYSSLFNSLSGNYNAANDMSNIIRQRSEIQSGSYGKLMKAYVGKVGNKAALNAYRESGSTASSVTDLKDNKETASVSTSKTSTPKTSFLDQHFSKISTGYKSRATADGTSFLDKHLNGDVKKTEGEVKETTNTEDADKYSTMRSSWLDNQLNTYNKEANKQTAADPSIAIATTV